MRPPASPARSSPRQCLHALALAHDEDFVPLFPTYGQPAEAPWRLALVAIFQFIEGLSDRAAANTVRSRIDWKYALSLELTDSGFDSSVLCEFRARLLDGDAEQLIFDKVGEARGDVVRGEPLYHQLGDAGGDLP